MKDGTGHSPPPSQVTQGLCKQPSSHHGAQVDEFTAQRKSTGGGIHSLPSDPPSHQQVKPQLRELRARRNLYSFGPTPAIPQRRKMRHRGYLPCPG